MKTFKSLREVMMMGTLIIPVPQGGGKFYDTEGELQFRVDSNYKIYNENGSYQGYMDIDNRVYDKNGNKIGEWKK